MPRTRLAMFFATAALGATVLLTPIALGSPAAKYSVSAVDFKFKNMPKVVKAGKQTFTLVNRGQATHDLSIAGKKTKILNPGQKASITVTLKPGKTYVFLCTVPGHAALGMKGKLVVKK